MQIITKIRLDAKNEPYWSCRVEHNGDTKMEVISETFLFTDKFRIWRLFRDVNMRLMTELEQMNDQGALRSLLMRDEEKRS